MKPRLERIPEFISKKEQKELIDWIEDGLEKGVLVKGNQEVSLVINTEKLLDLMKTL